MSLTTPLRGIRLCYFVVLLTFVITTFCLEESHRFMIIDEGFTGVLTWDKCAVRLGGSESWGVVFIIMLLLAAQVRSTKFSAASVVAYEDTPE